MLQFFLKGSQVYIAKEMGENILCSVKRTYNLTIGLREAARNGHWKRYSAGMNMDEEINPAKIPHFGTSFISPGQ